MIVQMQLGLHGKQCLLPLGVAVSNTRHYLWLLCKPIYPSQQVSLAGLTHHVVLLVAPQTGDEKLVN